MYVQLSWRNIWRNKRRTIIAAASVFFAVILAVLMRSLQLGSYAYMIDSSAKQYTGYFQVQDKHYWDERSLDETFILTDELKKNLSGTENVESLTPRLETFSLISRRKITKVAQVIGVDPESEKNMNGLDQKLIKGEYLSLNKNGVLVAEGLARMLEAQVGDSLVIYGVGYHGVPAAALLPVIGIVKLPFPILNNGTIFLNLSEAQYVFATGKRITSLSVMIDEVRHQDQVIQSVNAFLPPKLITMPWEEMMPELKQNIEFDNMGGIIMLIILYIIIAFGVFGTIMMMTQERSREFAILISVGMQKSRLMVTTLIESIMVSFVGAIVGMMGALPIIIYYYSHPIHLTGEAAEAYTKMGIEPIMAFTNDPTLFLTQAVTVFIIGLFCALYPVLYIHRLKPNQAIRG